MRAGVLASLDRGYGRARELVGARLLGIGAFVLLAVVGSVVFGQAPLYTSNQNQYFLHGLMQAGMGLLHADWLANTVDPTPVFSLLVERTARLHREGLFYVFQALIVGVYFHGLIRIGADVAAIDRSRAEFLAYLGLLLGMHSSLLGNLSLDLFGIDLRSVLTSGLAGQYLVGDIFQPSLFGVFLIVSIHAFIRRRTMAAAGYAAVAAAIHPAYLLAAGVLIASYVLVLLRETRNVRDVLRSGLPALVPLLLTGAYVAVVFRPTSAEAWAAAQNILMNVRLPHHALVARWLGPLAYVQLVLIAAGLIATRSCRRLFAVLVLSSVVALILTVIQAVTGNASLALVFPWRLSVYLVPIGSSVLAARVVSLGHARYVAKDLATTRILTQAAAALVVVLVLTGALFMRRAFAEARQDRVVPMMDFVLRTKMRGDVYVIPLGLERFRLHTGAPIFVDRKSIPYKDVEVVDWFSRYEAARTLYQLNDPALVCQALEKVMRQYAVTHVVLQRGQSDGTCRYLRPVYEDAEYGVYRITAR